MTVPDSPRMLGLTITRWRPGQQEAVCLLDDRPADVIAQVIEANTGWGKTVLLCAACLLEIQRSGGVAYYLTSTTALQEQALGDYPDLNVLRGKHKVDCLLDPKFKVDEARCQGGFICPLKSNCEYFVARDLARAGQARITAMTYAYMITERMRVGRLPPATALACDEAHNIEREFMEAISVKLTDKDCKAAHLPIAPRTLPAAARWVTTHKGSIERVLTILNEAKAEGELTDEERSRHRLYQRIATGMEGLLTAADEPKNWVVEKTEKLLEVRPIFIHEYASEVLWKGAGRIILTSATLPRHDYFARIVGLPAWEGHTLPAVFDAARRPVLIDPIRSRLNQSTEGAGTEAWDEMVEKVDQIIDLWPQAKGFIHSVSYARAAYVYEHSRHKDKMLQPRSSQELQEKVLRNWQRIKTPMWLVSPSTWEGIDVGANEHNAVQIILKLHHPFRGSKQVMARLNQDPEWAPFQTGLHLVQATGRGMRHADDQCVTYIIDPAIDWFLDRHPDFVPPWWLQSVHRRSA